MAPRQYISGWTVLFLLGLVLVLPGGAFLAAVRARDWLVAQAIVRVDQEVRRLKGSFIPGKESGEYTVLLNETRIADADLAPLAPFLSRIPLIVELDLRYTAISDAGLLHLQDARSTQALNVSGTRVTAEGVRRLHAALPDCWIIYGNPKRPQSVGWGTAMWIESGIQKE